ncbi:hypothetical protein [Larkinella humicola]|uniref:Uncharacterized protein n=1 Tax=Larkinella humicola TaxID=2607654 RepID=A0A5N1JNB5_9BACT|nr:hypothetical protein [Larkinella humicola]KAA9354717.1 hypothetical protein F0P93_08920 [Larkinella humicola]
MELLAVDLFFAVNLAVLLYDLLPNPLKIWHLCIYFLIWASISSMHGEWVHFLWFYWVIYWGVRYIYRPRQGLLYYLFVLSTVNFFMKANYGILSLGFVVSLLIYVYLSKQKKGHCFLYQVAILLALLMAGAHFLHTDLVNYFISSLHIISGYNESQAIYPDNRLRLVLLSYGMYLLQIATTLLYFYTLATSANKPKNKPYAALFSLVWLLIISFVLLKYAFTRADSGHLTVYIKQSSILLVLIIVSAKEDWIRKIFFVYLLLNSSFYLVFYVPVFGKMSVNYTTMFTQKVYILTHYFQSALTETYPVPRATIPARIRQKIGNQTTDRIPNEISEIYFNGLNYNPRPVIQSYQAYNWYLDTKNREKYLSKTAPDWIIYSYESIDGKYPLADETQTLLAILQRYRMADQTDGRLFLKKTDDIRPLHLVKKETIRLRMGEQLHFSGADSLLHVVYTKIHYSLYGKILNFLFQPPQLTMSIGAENNSTVTYRAVPVLLEKGMVVNARVDHLADAKEFLETLQVRQKRVTALAFHEKIRWKPGFDPDIEVTMHSYRLK